MLKCRASRDVNMERKKFGMQHGKVVHQHCGAISPGCVSPYSWDINIYVLLQPGPNHKRKMSNLCQGHRALK